MLLHERKETVWNYFDKVIFDYKVSISKKTLAALNLRNKGHFDNDDTTHKSPRGEEKTLQRILQ